MCRFVPFISAVVTFAALSMTAIAGNDTTEPPLIYSPWTKFCLNRLEAKQVRYTGKDGRLESGTIVGVVVIETEGQSKILRVMLLQPGMLFAHGIRAVIDQDLPAAPTHVRCFANGCTADYEATAHMIDALRKGRQFIVQAIDGSGTSINLVLPLSDFANAYDGLPTAPEAFYNQLKRLQQGPWKDDTLQPHLRPNVR
jgi:invasion protein IalB